MTAHDLLEAHPSLTASAERRLLLEIAEEIGTPYHVRTRIRAALSLETPLERQQRVELEYRARCIAAATGLLAITAEDARAILEMTWLEDASPAARDAFKRLERAVVGRGAALVGDV
jgi:hypothetical protein